MILITTASETEGAPGYPVAINIDLIETIVSYGPNSPTTVWGKDGRGWAAHESVTELRLRVCKARKNRVTPNLDVEQIADNVG